MTPWSTLRACLLGLTCLGGVLGASLSGYSSSSKPPVGDEGNAAEHSILLPSTSSQNHTTQPQTTQPQTLLAPLTGEEASLGAFDSFIAGLGRLSAALRDPEYDWEAAGEHSALTTLEEGIHERTYFRQDVTKIFSLAGTMMKLSNDIKLLSSDDVEMRSHPTPSAEAAASLPSSRVHAAVTEAVATLSHLFSVLWKESDGAEALNEEEGKALETKDGVDILIDNLDALANAQKIYTLIVQQSKTRPGGTSAASSTPEVAEASTPAQLNWQESERGLLQVVAQLKGLLGLLEPGGNDTALVTEPSTTPTTSTTSTTTTSTTTTSPGGFTTTTSTTTTSPGGNSKQSCQPPFELIAYRMCILQEMQLKLSWSDAQEFCRERGATLAGEMVVIKTRRYLNELYGEDGTRSRWPVWVGGRRTGETWMWGNQQVPEFLWAPGEPRAFSSHLAPEGLCMILDGYRRFHGASLPCHLRRRFVCQLNVM